MKMESFHAIELKNIGKSYGSRFALQDISMMLSKRQCLALVGHNGAGKTTLIKILLGLLKPSHGTVEVLHQDPASRHFNQLRSSIGFLPEQVLFQKTLTGRETLAFYARLKGLPTGNLDDYFDRVNLLAAADLRVGTYSKGMRQRLGIAQALLGQPSLLVLDEPTTGLDPVARQNIYSVINEEKKNGAAVLISSHVLTELDDRIDRVVILSNGKMAAQGSIPYLRRHIGMRSCIKITANPEICRNISEIFRVELPVDYSLGKEVTLKCLPEQKQEILKRVISMEVNITNIEVTDPSLEHVFNAYSNGHTNGRG